jgi:hypothetical protein
VQKVPFAGVAEDAVAAAEAAAAGAAEHRDVGDRGDVVDPALVGRLEDRDGGAPARGGLRGSAPPRGASVRNFAQSLIFRRLPDHAAPVVQEELVVLPLLVGDLREVADLLEGQQEEDDVRAAFTFSSPIGRILRSGSENLTFLGGGGRDLLQRVDDRVDEVRAPRGRRARRGAA